MTTDIKLSSGRTIVIRPMDNGASEAVPTTGSYGMTHDEGLEFWKLHLVVLKEAAAARKILARGMARDAQNTTKRKLS